MFGKPTHDAPRPTSRYGMDALGGLLIAAGLVCIVLSFFGAGIDPMLFTLPFAVGTALLIYEAFRASSTDLAARTKENNKLFGRSKNQSDTKDARKKERAEKRAESKSRAQEQRKEAKKAQQATSGEREASEDPKHQDSESSTAQCPACGQSLRVPVGKGKVRITCPKCKNAFILHT